MTRIYLAGHGTHGRPTWRRRRTRRSKTRFETASRIPLADAMQELLLAWFNRNARDLPWRHTRDPYAILVSEVMLQQYCVESVELPAERAFSA